MQVLLSILKFVVCCAAMTFLTSKLISWVATFTIERLACEISLRICKDYLMENGRGFYPEQNEVAESAEVFYRTWAILISYIILLALVIILFPSWLAFWIIPKWSLKVGALLGVLLVGVATWLTSAFTESNVGLLTDIDEKGIGHFQKPNGETFEFNIGMFWEKDDYPPINARYLCLNFILAGGMVSLELSPSDMYISY